MSSTTVSISAISDPNKLLKIEGVWNTLIHKYNKNPIFLSGFVKQFMGVNRSKGWVPLVLVISADEMIVGIVPLMIKKKFGLCFVKFLFKSWLSPDFIVDDQYRETCIARTLDFLFKTLRCHFADFTVPAESLNLQILKQKCKAKRIYFCTIPAMGHYIIPVGCAWDEFKKLRGKKFRQDLRRIERLLDRAGSWAVIYVENRNKESDVFKRILDVERMSWKEAWRTQRRIRIDQDLLKIWKGSQYAVRTEPDFKWSVWFLELNGKTIAYTLVLRYQEEAFIMKTSYDERYRKFYPGVYVNNAAVRELFNSREVKNIDWLTDLPFLRTWTSKCLPRVRVMMSRKGVSSIIMRASAELIALLGTRSPHQLKQTRAELRAFGKGMLTSLYHRITKK